MKVYTSYFAIQCENPKAKAVCAIPPKFFHGPNIKEFAPSEVLLRELKSGYIDKQEYFSLYRKKLNKLKPTNIKKLIHSGDVFLCWEKDYDNCHRHVLAEFLREHGYDVEEVVEKYVSENH